MKKVQIVLDEKKILADNQYNLQKIYAVIDSVFVDKYGLLKGQDGFYLEI
ncbi:MAG: hypothetical protein LBN22_01880 [Clostridiales Family XIII bacterium]|jgi:hypothetical protein|nr:hypothetical protein [Clostridiales Family XIII bacterium]